MSFYIVVSTNTGSVEKRLSADKITYDVNIHDQFALCTLKQYYHIGVDVSEASYKFPIDYNSAFCDLVIETPREKFRANVKEKVEARKIFDDAKRANKSAFLAEETKLDRDIYKLSICNVLKGDEIVVEYIYITEITHNNGKNIFYVPSFISPRYGGSDCITANYSLSTKIKINGNPKSLQCSMPLAIIDYHDDHITINFTSDKTLDKDIEIIYDGKYPAKAMKFIESGYNLAIAQFTPQINLATNLIDIVFILDCSGSMSGDRIENSKKAIIYCLEKMLNSVKVGNFNIMTFGSDYQLYSPTMLVANNENISAAINFCNSIEANMGGTEIYTALKASLELCKSAILITDGDTSGNNDMHKLCSNFNCLSVLGIGSGINRGNIADMAKYGNGLALYNQNDLNITNNISILFDSVTNPSVKNPIINWTKNPNVLTSKCTAIISNKPDLIYALTKDTNPFVDLYIEDIDLSIRTTPINNYIDTKYLACLAAKRIIQQNDIDKKDLVELAVNFNIITQYTSFIAVSSLDTIVSDDNNLYSKNNLHYLKSGTTGHTFNNNLMGKRVNLSGRSVITSDPNIALNDVGNDKSRVHKSLIDKSTDYIFEYFINEDKFNNGMSLSKNTYTKTIDTYDVIEPIDFKIYSNETIIRDSVISDPNGISDITNYENNPYAMSPKSFASIQNNMLGGVFDHRLGITESSNLCGPSLRIPMQHVYNISLPGSTGENIVQNKITTQTNTLNQVTDRISNIISDSCIEFISPDIIQDTARTTLRESTVNIPHRLLSCSQEDSFVFNKPTNEKGLFRNLALKKYPKEIKQVPHINIFDGIDLDIYFDKSTGLFKKTIIEIVDFVPVHLLNDERGLTLFILDLMKKINYVNFEKYEKIFNIQHNI